MAGSVEIVEVDEPIRFVYIDVVGPYFETDLAFQNLRKNPKLADLILSPLQRISIWLDDPDVVEPQSLRSRLGIRIQSNDVSDLHLPVAEIRMGKYAKMTFKGKRSEVADAWKFLYGVWLPHSEQAIQAGYPGFQIDFDEDGDNVRCDLYVELKK